MHEYEIFIEEINPCGGERHSKKTLIEAEAVSPEAYVKENPKEEYTTDDFIALHNKSMHWEGCKADKGLIPMYGINGKTTAKRNGASDDYGTGQDWR